jgi:hypothetical protein
MNIHSLKRKEDNMDLELEKSKRVTELYFENKSLDAALEQAVKEFTKKPRKPRRKKVKVIVNHNKRWTTEQENFLIDNFGKLSYETIAKSKVIQKTHLAVERKARSMNLGNPKDYDDSMTRNYFCKKIDIDPKTFNRWDKKFGLKTITKVVAIKQKIVTVKLTDFWEWSENHQNLINWNKFKEDALGVEPNWTKKARADYRKKYPEKHNISWTNEEDKMLMSYFKLGLPLAKIAKNMKKRRSAVDARLGKIYAERKHMHEWTLGELEVMKGYINQGLSIRQTAKKMNLSFYCIKGAVERYINKPNRKPKIIPKENTICI